MLDLLVYVLPLFSSTWLSPLLSFISSSLPLLLPFYLSTFSSFQPHSREFAISPWPMKYANKVFCLTYQIRIDIQHAFLTGALVLCCFGCLTVDSWCFGLSRMYQRPTAVASTKLMVTFRVESTRLDAWKMDGMNQPEINWSQFLNWLPVKSTTDQPRLIRPFWWSYPKLCQPPESTRFLVNLNNNL
jgi:hypothetical protein